MANSNEYMREYMLRRYHERRAEAILKLGSKCAECGATEHLEIDHIDPALKTIDLAKLWSIAKKRFEDELKKCQLLCHDCHLEKSIAEKSVEHGGGVSGKRNCKCKACKAKKAEYTRMYKKHGRVTEWPMGLDF